MLSKHIVSQKTLYLPDYRPRYRVSADGSIFDENEEKTVLPDSTGHVDIVFLMKEVRVKVEWVLAMAFKPLYASKTFCLNWSVVFADRNKHNLSLDNLIWQPPIGGQPCPEAPGFYVIPGASSYAVSIDGLVYSRRRDCLIEVRQSSNDYLIFSVRLDNQLIDPKPLTIFTLAVHRALGLALLPLEEWERAESMQINHKDGNKLNNHLGNLEWSDNSHNVKHAYANQLNVPSISKKVVLRSPRNEVVASFVNINQAMVVLKAGRRMLKHHAENQIPLADGNFIEIESDKLDGDFRCVAVSLFTNADGTRTTLRADSPFKLSKMTGTTIDKVNVALSKESQWPCDNFVYYWAEAYDKHVANNTLRSFSEIEVSGLMNQSGIHKPIILTWLDSGKKQVFKSTTSFNRYVANDPSLRAKMPSGGEYPAYFGKYYYYEYIES